MISFEFHKMEISIHFSFLSFPFCWLPLQLLSNSVRTEQLETQSVCQSYLQPQSWRKCKLCLIVVFNLIYSYLKLSDLITM